MKKKELPAGKVIYNKKHEFIWFFFATKDYAAVKVTFFYKETPNDFWWKKTAYKSHANLNYYKKKR